MIKKSKIKKLKDNKYRVYSEKEETWVHLILNQKQKIDLKR